MAANRARKMSVGGFMGRESGMDSHVNHDGGFRNPRENFGGMKVLRPLLAVILSAAQAVKWAERSRRTPWSFVRSSNAIPV